MMIELNAENVTKLINDITPQWLAGFFDGEGHVTIGLKGAQVKENRNTYKLMVGVTQKDRTILQLILIKFPQGHITSKSNGVYSINFDNNGARPFIDYIKDFVIVKKFDIDIAIKYLETVGAQYTSRTTEAEYKLRIDLREKLLSIR